MQLASQGGRGRAVLIWGVVGQEHRALVKVRGRITKGLVWGLSEGVCRGGVGDRH